MTNSQSLETICPYNVEEKISAPDIKRICIENDIVLVTSYNELARDINLYYEGYLQHKRIYGGKKNENCLTKNQIEEKLEKVSKATTKLIECLENIYQNSDDFLLTALNMQMYLASKRKESDVDNVQCIIKTLVSLKKEAERSKTDPNFDYYPSIALESSSREWFLGKAMPEIYEKHTGKRYSRAYSKDHSKAHNSDTRCGKPHKFTKAILACLDSDDFRNITDEAINTAPKNYQASLVKNKKTHNSREYGWPYTWVDY